jgi:voltage-gated potassium channel
MDSSPPRVRISTAELLARVMVSVSVLYLLVLAYGIHRARHWEASDLIEEDIVMAALGGLWVLVLAEGVHRFLTTRQSESLRNRIGLFALVAIVPPVRLGVASPQRPGMLWFPGLGWKQVDAKLRKRLEQLFSVPMIIMALLVLPVMALDLYGWSHHIDAYGLRLFLDIGNSAIWFAFALEFVVMVSVAENKLKYCAANWMNLAIILLPLIEFLPILRLLRLTRLAQVQRLSGLTRVYSNVYRFRGLLMRAWRALILLNLIRRLWGNTLERQLAQLEAELTKKEQELEELRQEIADLRARIVERDRLVQEAKASAPASPGASDPVESQVG